MLTEPNHINTIKTEKQDIFVFRVCSSLIYMVLKAEGISGIFRWVGVHPCPSSLFFSQCCLPLFLLANMSRHRYTGVSDTFLELGSLLCTSCLLRPFSLTSSLETMRNSAWRSCHACLLCCLLVCCMDIAWFIQSVSSSGNLWLFPDFISFVISHFFCSCISTVLSSHGS